MKLKRIFTSTLSVLLLTGFLVTTPAEASAPGSAFADNSKEYQELKQLAQSFQRGGSCYIDDYEAEGALEYVENALYSGFDSQEEFNLAMKKSYGYLLYDCQTMSKQPEEEPEPEETQPEKPKPKETQAEKPAAPKETQAEKPKPTKPEKPQSTKPNKPKQENNVSSKPKPSNSTQEKNNNTSTKPSQSSTSSEHKSTQSTVSTTETKPSNSSTVKETTKETTKETVKETVVETPKEAHEHGSHEDSLESLKDKEIIKVQKHGDYWHVFDKDGNKYVTHEDPTHLLNKKEETIKETQKETDKEMVTENSKDDIKEEQSKSRIILYTSGLVLVATVAGVLIAVDRKRKNK